MVFQRPNPFPKSVYDNVAYGPRLNALAPAAELPALNGRDHNHYGFSMWMAGGGVRPGTVHGETDEFSYNVVKDPVHINDFNATMLHCLGIDHSRFTFKSQGLDMRLTGVEPARVVKGILA